MTDVDTSDEAALEPPVKPVELEQALIDVTDPDVLRGLIEKRLDLMHGAEAGCGRCDHYSTKLTSIAVLSEIGEGDEEYFDDPDIVRIIDRFEDMERNADRLDRDKEVDAALGLAIRKPTVERIDRVAERATKRLFPGDEPIDEEEAVQGLAVLSSSLLHKARFVSNPDTYDPVLNAILSKASEHITLRVDGDLLGYLETMGASEYSKVSGRLLADGSSAHWVETKIRNMIYLMGQRRSAHRAMKAKYYLRDHEPNDEDPRPSSEELKLQNDTRFRERITEKIDRPMASTSLLFVEDSDDGYKGDQPEVHLVVHTGSTEREILKLNHMPAIWKRTQNDAFIGAVSIRRGDIDDFRMGIIPEARITDQGEIVQGHDALHYFYIGRDGELYLNRACTMSALDGADDEESRRNYERFRSFVLVGTELAYSGGNETDRTLEGLLKYLDHELVVDLHRLTQKERQTQSPMEQMAAALKVFSRFQTLGAEREIAFGEKLARLSFHMRDFEEQKPEMFIQLKQLKSELLFAGVAIKLLADALYDLDDESAKQAFEVMLASMLTMTKPTIRRTILQHAPSRDAARLDESHRLTIESSQITSAFEDIFGDLSDDERRIMVGLAHASLQFEVDEERHNLYTPIYTLMDDAQNDPESKLDSWNYLAPYVLFTDLIGELAEYDLSDSMPATRLHALAFMSFLEQGDVEQKVARIAGVYLHKFESQAEKALFLRSFIVAEYLNDGDGETLLRAVEVLPPAEAKQLIEIMHGIYMETDSFTARLINIVMADEKSPLLDAYKTHAAPFIEEENIRNYLHGGAVIIPDKLGKADYILAARRAILNRAAGVLTLFEKVSGDQFVTAHTLWGTKPKEFTIATNEEVLGALDLLQKSVSELSSGLSGPIEKVPALGDDMHTVYRAGNVRIALRPEQAGDGAEARVNFTIEHDSLTTDAAMPHIRQIFGHEISLDAVIGNNKNARDVRSISLRIDLERGGEVSFDIGTSGHIQKNPLGNYLATIITAGAQQSKSKDGTQSSTASYHAREMFDDDLQHQSSRFRKFVRMLTRSLDKHAEKD